MICGENDKRRHSVDYHHYYPKPYRRKRNRDGDYICQDFHRWMHKNYSNQELATAFYNPDSLYELKELYDMDN